MEREKEGEVKCEKVRGRKKIRISGMNSNLKNLSTSKVSLKLILILCGQRGFLLADRCSLGD